MYFENCEKLNDRPTAQTRCDAMLIILLLSSDARRSLGLGRSGIPPELDDSTSNNRSAEGTWPHIRAAHASRSVGMSSVRDLIEIQ